MSCCEKNCGCDAGSRLSPGRRVILAGNPNCGKSTLFNALTGARQRVGNWPGVTVECKSGTFTQDNTTVEVIDLPGVYSLSHAFDSGALDECIACEFIMKNEADVIINIVDASHLERHLYFTIELLEMGLPVVLALNMMDAARAKGLQIDTEQLSARLGCPVVTLEAHKGYGVAELKRAVVQDVAPAQLKIEYPVAIEKAVADVARVRSLHPGAESAEATLHPGTESAEATFPGCKERTRATTIRLLEGDDCMEESITPEIALRVKELRASIQASTNEEIDILLADARFRFIQKVVKQSTQQVRHVKTSWTHRIDNIVLNRFLGIPIFLGVMYLLFVFAINVGGAFQDFFDLSSQAVFVDSVAYWLAQWHTPAWLIALLADGVGKGINTTLTFVPVIGAMFLFMAFLEDSGYMARAAFVVDRVMRLLGLPGKAFVPMIVGFGCNVPAVMAARTLDNQRDRIITVMMSPFMSCGARLAIYAVFTATFFPLGGQNIVFALYLIGVLAAVFTGFILRKTMLKGEPAPLLMELPAYHMPQLKSLLLHAWQRLNGFVLRAGVLIVPICALFGILSISDAQGRSLLSVIGTWLVPVFSPLGIQADNWPAAVGLLTGVLAKEVVIGTLNTLYAQMGHLAANGDSDFHFLASIQAAWQTIPDNFAQLTGALSNPVLAKAPITTLSQSVSGLMSQRFDGQVGAFAYLLFVLLYFPCVSTLGAMLRELPRRWAIFSALWTTGIAYCIAVIFYQTATFAQHHLSSLLWLGAMLTALIITIATVRACADEKLVLSPDLNREAA